MLYNFQRKKLCRHLLVGGALFAAGLGMYSCTDSYDLDDTQPSNLNNIYGYMEEQGNFSNYLHLIDDLGLKEILSKTGSETMFIADDDAFARFYASNAWGVKSYDQLSSAQKALLLRSSMIDNPYTTTMLSSAESQSSTGGKPIKGEVCRRASSLSLYDSVMVVGSKSDKANEILPDNALFNEIRAYHDSIVLFTDDSYAPPMIHFTGQFVVSNKMENTDIDFLYNLQPGTFTSDDVYVNNSKVIKTNLFCKNGFVHQVDNVIMPLDNMAEIIRKKPNLSAFSKILERFAAPDSVPTLTTTYNQQYGKQGTNVYVKRYFSNRSKGSTQGSDQSYLVDKNNQPFDQGKSVLKYDPGWNAYVPLITNERQPMMEDMAVMFVPSDAAINDWWENGGGKVIEKFYHTLDNTPNKVLDDLINVNMMQSFVSSVPSKFESVLNDANEVMGITTADIDSVYLGCNGAVYVTNKVFAPATYSSVLFPTVIDTVQFNVLSNVIENLNYDKYLNSMVVEYVLLLPTTNGLLSYIDPVSYGQNQTQLWQFYLDISKKSKEQLCADVYKCIINEDGTWNIDPANPNKQKTITGGMTNSVLKNRIEDMLDNMIIVEAYDPNKQFYKTKGRTFVQIKNAGADQYDVYTSWQKEIGKPLPSSNAYNMNNGVAIVVDGPTLATSKSAAKILNETVVDGDSIFKSFFEIAEEAGAFNKTNGKDGWSAGDQKIGNLFNLKAKGSVGAEDATSDKGKATYLLSNYHYTLYAPTNEAMAAAFKAGLPDLDSLRRAEEYDIQEDLNAASDTASHAAKVREVWLDFVKYHIQDNSVFVDNGFKSLPYETAKTQLIRSTASADPGSNNYEVIEGDDKHVLVKGVKISGKTADRVCEVISWEAGVPHGEGSVEYYPGTYTASRPYSVTVNVNSGGIQLKDVEGGVANVVMKPGAYNLMGREYWYTGTNIEMPYNAVINNSSSIVVHAIDAPLFFDKKNQFGYIYKPLSSE